MYQLYHASLDIKCIIANGQTINYAGGDYIRMLHDHPLVDIKYPTIISEYLQWEVQLGRMCKHEVKSPKIHLSPLGAIPKKHKLGKWRLIVELSFPDGASINGGISAEWSSVLYVPIDHLSSVVISTGREAFLVKANMKRHIGCFQFTLRIKL